MDRNEPTIKANQGVRFYNPGDRISEPIPYSLVTDGDIHCIARYTMEAPEHDFFFVPTELRIISDGQRLAVDFPATVAMKFGERGVVMIDSEYEPCGTQEIDDAAPFAKTADEAKEKGDARWQDYLWSIVNRWKAQCENIQRTGNVPERASGFTKRAITILGLRDPALSLQEQAKRESSTESALKSVSDERVAQLQSEIESMKSLMSDMAAKFAASTRLESNRNTERAAAKGSGKKNS